VFARNEPVVIVAAAEARTIRSLSDLALAKQVVLGAPEVPIGRYSEQILERADRQLGHDFRARVMARVVSRELNVRQVLAKVKLGSADAGIVYRSDAHGAPELGVVTIAPELNVIAEYPIAMVTDAPHAKLAAEWIALVRSPAGQAALQRGGLLLPEAQAR
jgi:molybdate transport system substrate-binding protein